LNDLNKFNHLVEAIKDKIEQTKDSVFRVIPIGEYYSIVFFDVNTNTIKLDFTNCMFHPVNIDQLDRSICSMELLEASYTHIQHSVIIRRWLSGELDDDKEPGGLEFPFDKNEEAISAFRQYVNQLRVMEPSNNTADDYGIPENLLG